MSRTLAFSSLLDMRVGLGGMGGADGQTTSFFLGWRQRMLCITQLFSDWLRNSVVLLAIRSPF